MEKYLEHHGILGQKWGVRRYQNPDGSLTDAGRKHIQSTDAKSLRKELYKDVKKQRASIHGGSNRWAHDLYIGENSKKAIDENNKRLRVIESKASKELKKTESDLERHYNSGKIDYEEYDRRVSEANEKYINETGIRKYSGIKTYTKEGVKYAQEYLDNAGKTITIGMLKDLGYNDESSEYIEEVLRKHGQTLSF